MNRLFLVGLLLMAATTLARAQGSCVSGNCQNGQGKYRFTDGATYQGGFKHGKFHGQGIMHYPNKDTYVGNWRNNLQEGRGRMTTRDNFYLGSFHEGKRHGAGEVTYTNGNKLTGNWAFGQVNGEATFTFSNGDRYQGELKGEVFDGFGTMQYFRGDSYTGQWRDNRRSGPGKMIFSDGSELEGNWENDEFRADWALLAYQGNRNGAPDCTLGCPGGSGRFNYPNGQTWYGPVKVDGPNGNGTLVLANGNVYHGGYRGHQQDGLGIMYYADGHISGGLWRNGQLFRELFSAVGRPVQDIAVDADPAVKIWAVVVGAARYNHMPTLTYTDDDAYQFYAFLRSVEGGALPDEQVRILIDDNATHRNILMAMREVYQRADENDVVLFYFSGHGLPGAFLPVDYDGVENRLEHYQLRDALLSSRSRHKLVIADACHSGSLAGRQALASKGGGGAEAALTAFYQGLNDARASTALLLSSKGEEISLEDRGLRSGIFSHFLIEGMKGKADADGNQLVTIQELFGYVHGEVRRYTGNIQTPTLTGDYDGAMPVSVIRGRR